MPFCHAEKANRKTAGIEAVCVYLSVSSVVSNDLVLVCCRVVLVLDAVGEQFQDLDFCQEEESGLTVAK